MRIKELTTKFNAERETLVLKIEGLELKIIQLGAKIKMLEHENEEVIVRNASLLKDIESWSRRYEETQFKYMDEISTLKVQIQSTSNASVVSSIRGSMDRIVLGGRAEGDHP